jgi:hypothetical protein
MKGGERKLKQYFIYGTNKNINRKGGENGENQMGIGSSHYCYADGIIAV